MGRIKVSLSSLFAAEGVSRATVFGGDGKKKGLDHPGLTIHTSKPNMCFSPGR
jgi:hypothetical protein